jgi:uncharacterized protein
MLDSVQAAVANGDGIMGSPAPVTGVCERISNQMIEEVVQQIVERFQPRRIILFGSYATGQQRSDSDVDLLVVMDTRLNERAQAARICQSIEYHFALDLIVRTPAVLERRLALGDLFLLELLRDGKVLYERANCRMGRQSGS